MRILRSIFTLSLAIALVSCSSVSKIPVPPALNNTVNIIAKKVALTDEQKKNWAHADLITDTIPGLSLAKAYKFLEGKKSVTVIVGVVDSGADIEHEDLQSVIWINPKEIAGNGIDDDKNGFIDDVHGWNFLGKSLHENLELTRLLKNSNHALTVKTMHILLMPIKKTSKHIKKSSKFMMPSKKV